MGWGGQKWGRKTNFKVRKYFLMLTVHIELGVLWTRSLLHLLKWVDCQSDRQTDCHITSQTSYSVRKWSRINILVYCTSLIMPDVWGVISEPCMNYIVVAAFFVCLFTDSEKNWHSNWQFSWGNLFLGQNRQNI